MTTLAKPGHQQEVDAIERTFTAAIAQQVDELHAAATAPKADTLHPITRDASGTPMSFDDLIYSRDFTALLKKVFVCTGGGRLIVNQNNQQRGHRDDCVCIDVHELWSRGEGLPRWASIEAEDGDGWIPGCVRFSHAERIGGRWMAFYDVEN